MNGLLKLAMFEAKRADDDPRDALLRPAPGNQSPVVDSVLKPETQGTRSSDDVKKKQKLDALRPLA